MANKRPPPPEDAQQRALGGCGGAAVPRCAFQSRLRSWRPLPRPTPVALHGLSDIRGDLHQDDMSASATSLDSLALEDPNSPNMKAIMARRSMKMKRKGSISSEPTDYISWILVFITIAITVLGYPDWSEPHASVHHVWYYGWITAVSTGVGVLPFFFLSEPNKFWMGISNAMAGGMMLAASYSLVVEGCLFEDSKFGLLSLMPRIDPATHSFIRTAIGFAIGLLFILLTKTIMHKFEDMNVMDGNVSTQRMVLIVIVMTLHSMSEGIGIGVSFGGKSGMKLGQFIAMSLAVHNVPEGLAVGLVMSARKVSTLRTVLWAIFTSLPQPLFSVPAFLFIEKFVPLLPGGLGFAAGAMSYVAVFELLSEAAEDTNSSLLTAIMGVISCMFMTLLQDYVKGAV